MPTAAPVSRSTPLTIAPDATEFTDVQLSVLELQSRWPAPPPAAALHLLFYSTRISGLDPFLGQIRLLRRREPVREPSGSTRMEERWSVETSIYGFRIIGHRTAAAHNAVVEQSAPRYYDDRARAWVEAWPYSTPPVAARCILTATTPEGTRRRAVGLVHFAEFAKTTVTGEPALSWAEIPVHMLFKCAEADAWRRLFPHELGYLSLSDSAAAANDTAVIAPAAGPLSPAPRSATTVLGPPTTAQPRRAPEPDTAAPPTPGPTTTEPAATEPAATEEHATAAPASGRRTRQTTSRPRTASDPVSAFLAEAATALGRDDKAVLSWAADVLGNPVATAADLTADQVTTLRAALPGPGTTS